MSALTKKKHKKDPSKSFSSNSPVVDVCAVEISGWRNLSDSNRLDDLEYRRAANHKEKEGEKPRSNTHFVIAAFLKIKKKPFQLLTNFSAGISTFALWRVKTQFFSLFSSPEQANMMGKKCAMNWTRSTFLSRITFVGVITGFWENYVVFFGSFCK